jgi:hypothetical protein
MATGDITLSVAVEGGSAKTVTIDSATRVLAKARADALNSGTDLSADADYQVHIVNKFAGMVVADGNAQAEASAVNGLSRKTFTAAS